MGKDISVVSIRKKKHLLEYYNRISFSIENNYTAIKQKFYIIFKTLKKFKYLLYKISFVLEMNTNILVV